MPRNGKKANRRQRGESSIYQRKDGRWVCEIHLGYKPDGKPDRKYLYADTAEAVIKKRDEYKKQLSEGFTPPKGRGETVGKWLTFWLHEVIKAEVRSSTWEDSYRPKIGHAIAYLGKGPLKALDEEKVEAFYRHMQAPKPEGLGLSASTTLQTHRILSKALKRAVRLKKIQRNPCALAEAPTVRREEPVPPDRDEAAEIITAARDRRNGVRWVLNLASGPRQGEALGLMWPMVDLRDLDNASITIAWELQRQRWNHGCEDPHACGKTRHRYPCPPSRAACPRVRTSGRPHVCQHRCPARCTAHSTCPTFCDAACEGHASSCPLRVGGGLVLVEPKSAKSKRTFDIPRELAEMFVEHRAAQRTEREERAATWTGWVHRCERRPKSRELICPGCRMPVRRDLLVFTQLDGGPIDARRDWQEWADLLAELDMAHYRIHDGRHFSVTTQIEEGLDPRVVQENHGHASAAFTQDYYAHVTPRQRRNSAVVIGEALFQ